MPAMDAELSIGAFSRMTFLSAARAVAGGALCLAGAWAGFTWFERLSRDRATLSLT